MNTTNLIDEAVSLPVEERIFMIDILLKSLNPPDSIIDKKWILTARRRLSEIKSGQVKTVPGQLVFDKIKDKFKK